MANKRPKQKDLFNEAVNLFISKNSQEKTNEYLLDKGKSSITKHEIAAYILVYSKGVENQTTDVWKNPDDKEWYFKTFLSKAYKSKSADTKTEKNKDNKDNKDNTQTELQFNVVEARKEFLNHYKIQRKVKKFDAFQDILGIQKQ